MKIEGSKVTVHFRDWKELVGRKIRQQTSSNPISIRFCAHHYPLVILYPLCLLQSRNTTAALLVHSSELKDTLSTHCTLRFTRTYVIKHISVLGERTPRSAPLRITTNGVFDWSVCCHKHVGSQKGTRFWRAVHRSNSPSSWHRV